MEKQEDAIRAFAKDVMEGIAPYLRKKTPEIECTPKETRKNNGVNKIGISFRKPDSNTSVILYMEDFYKEFQNGRPLENIVENIAAQMERAMEDRVFTGRISIGSYESIKEKLALKLINAKFNRGYLESHPYWRMEDLAVVCKIVLPGGAEGYYGSIAIDNQMLSQWGITKEELFHTALENMAKEDPPVLNDVYEITGSIEVDENLNPVRMYKEMDEIENILETRERPLKDGMPELYVLRNMTAIDGAAAILYPEIMDDVCSLLPEGFYLLPSSIHEWLLIPKDHCLSPEELGSFVREVNETKVLPEERLSDHIYEYDRERGRICLVQESREKSREMER